ncbi:Carboxypeptidase S1 [Tolypocladium ophioglossoides CBS 100239]|uniref:Carboxypeptidase n=1 Tax=Tolypocladium ophioglossoides (strain CBS 100239) TaxID=1163406 RepID=A0A0L0NA56_TOLOC|nr:Carboxypeptidase S1 [Tolypocladium ophioglossoides CBS 100239]
MRLSLATLLAACGPAIAQFVVQDREARNLTVVRSPGADNVTISYKVPNGTCKTAFDKQKQYTGWVNIPGDFPTNLFFWFVEARNPTDSLTVWLNGGPGSSSMYGFFAGNGPCEIIEKGLDNYDTAAREWGWDRASNMLFIDQPNQVGFSYDTPTNGTKSMINGSDSSPAWNLVNGTFSTNSGNSTANTTQIAAMAVWHTVQGFLTTFPRYQPRANASMAVNLFAESYGGVYGPIFAETWQAQNQKRLTGALSRNSTLELRLTSLGIVNGCVDRILQVPMYPTFANNNTYGVKAMSNEEAKFYLNKFAGNAGCKDLLTQCQTAATQKDPEGKGDQPDVNDVCSQASEACNDIEGAYYSSGRGAYDLAAASADPQPALFFADYLNQGSVQKAIGAPVNYTVDNDSVSKSFLSTGDVSRGGNIGRLANLLKSGVRVGLIYGDRDYICNWFGGEAVSLAIAQQAGGDYAAKFPAAGYAPIIANDSYVGGEVRQYGNLSFSRVYQAGHSVAWYQPETAFQLFARIMMGKSVSTGSDIDLASFNTTGPLNSTQTAKLPTAPKPTCFVRAFDSTCDTDAQKLAANNGGVVINGILYSKSEDWPLATTQKPTSTAKPTSSQTMTMTGVYTATKTPSSAASSMRSAFPLWELLALYGLMCLT